MSRYIVIPILLLVSDCSVILASIRIDPSTQLESLKGTYVLPFEHVWCGDYTIAGDDHGGIWIHKDKEGHWKTDTGDDVKSR